VWQLDFSEFETTGGGTWRLAACRDYWSKYGFGWHLTPTANQHDAVAAIELAIAKAERLAGGVPLLEQVTDTATGEIRRVTVVTDNGGPFRSFRFEAYIATRPELHHVRTRVRTPGQNGGRERGFGTLKYEWLYRHDIDHALDLAEYAEAYRLDYKHRPPARSPRLEPPDRGPPRPRRPDSPNFPDQEILPTA
jgi:putative transposase